VALGSGLKSPAALRSRFAKASSNAMKECVDEDRAALGINSSDAFAQEQPIDNRAKGYLKVLSLGSLGDH